MSLGRDAPAAPEEFAGKTEETIMTKPTRRTVVLTGVASLAAPWVARAAEPDFRLKFGNIVSGDHPLNTSMAKVRDRVARETDGKVMIELFPKKLG